MANHNSARRLYDFLKYCADYSPKEQVFGYVLCEYYGTNSSNATELFSTITKYSELIEQVRKGIMEHEELDPSYVNMLAPLLDHHSPIVFDKSLSAFLAYYTDSRRFALHSCSSFLGEIENEPDVAEEDLEKLREQLDDLQKEILESVSDEELRAVLFELVSTAIQGITSYKFTGVVSFKKTYATLYGELLIAYSQYSNSTNPRSEENESTTSMFNKVGKVLNSINELSGNVCDTLELGSSIVSTVAAISNALPK